MNLCNKNYIKNIFEHFLAKLLDPQKSLFLKMKLSKNSLYKSWAHRLIFSN